MRFLLEFGKNTEKDTEKFSCTFFVNFSLFFSGFLDGRSLQLFHLKKSKAEVSLHILIDVFTQHKPISPI